MPIASIYRRRNVNRVCMSHVGAKVFFFLNNSKCSDNNIFYSKNLQINCFKFPSYFIYYLLLLKRQFKCQRFIFSLSMFKIGGTISPFRSYDRKRSNRKYVRFAHATTPEAGHLARNVSEM